MTIKDEHAASNSARGPAWMAVGGLLGALAASSCCILPLVLFGLLGVGYWLVYRAPKRACVDGGVCARPLPNRLVKSALILATILVAVALSFDLFAPLLLN